MQTLKFIKKINILKKIDNIGSQHLYIVNFYESYHSCFKKHEFYENNEKLFYTINLKKNNSLFVNSNKIKCYSKFHQIFDIYINFMFMIDNETIYFYRNHMNLKTYSSYDITMLYSLATLNIIKAGLFLRKNVNSVLNIRDTFKATNEKVLNKSSIIDLTIKKLIENKLKYKVSMSFDQYSVKFFKRRTLFVRILRRKLRRMKRMLRGAKLSVRNFLRLSLVFLCTKDIDIFAKVILKIMNAMHYKNHRRFLYYLKLFINKSMNYYYDVLKFEGFFFYLSGKISGGGNSKKKRYAIRCGKYSLTNKMLKLKFKKGLIHTKTGVLGYRFMISYN